jgi:hypothetical protein
VLFPGCIWVCLCTGALHAQGNSGQNKAKTVKNTQDISGELDRETDLQAQLDRTLGPTSEAVKQTASGAHRIKAHFRPGTPEYGQASELYRRVRQDMDKLQGELTDAVKTVKQDDSGERAARVNKQVIADLNDALQRFGDFTNRLVPAPPAEQPKQPANLPQAGEPAGQPTPPGQTVQPVQPEQYVAAQQQAGQISADVVVQVCNLFVEHAAGLSDRSADGIRQQMMRKIRSHVALPAFGGA